MWVHIHSRYRPSVIVNVNPLRALVVCSGIGRIMILTRRSTGVAEARMERCSCWYVRVPPDVLFR